MQAVAYVVVRERMERNPGCFWWAIDAVLPGGKRLRVADGLDTKREAVELADRLRGEESKEVRR